MQQTAPQAALTKGFVNQLRALRRHDTLPVLENHFTASLAIALAASEAFRCRFVQRLVGGPTWRGITVKRAHVDVRFQEAVSIGRKRGFMDIRLRVNGHRIAVEGKLKAAEGVDADGRR